MSLSPFLLLRHKSKICLTPRMCGLGVIYLPVVRQTDDSKPLASQQPVYMAPVVSHTNETRKAEKELVVLRLVTSAS